MHCECPNDGGAPVKLAALLGRPVEDGGVKRQNSTRLPHAAAACTECQCWVTTRLWPSRCAPVQKAGSACHHAGPTPAPKGRCALQALCCAVHARARTHEYVRTCGRGRPVKDAGAPSATPLCMRAAGARRQRKREREKPMGRGSCPEATCTCPSDLNRPDLPR